MPNWVDLTFVLVGEKESVKFILNALTGGKELSEIRFSEFGLHNFLPLDETELKKAVQKYKPMLDEDGRRFLENLVKQALEADDEVNREYSLWGTKWGYCYDENVPASDRVFYDEFDDEAVLTMYCEVPWGEPYNAHDLMLMFKGVKLIATAGTGEVDYPYCYVRNRSRDVFYFEIDSIENYEEGDRYDDLEEDELVYEKYLGKVYVPARLEKEMHNMLVEHIAQCTGAGRFTVGQAVSEIMSALQSDVPAPVSPLTKLMVRYVMFDGVRWKFRRWKNGGIEATCYSSGDTPHVRASIPFEIIETFLENVELHDGIAITPVQPLLKEEWLGRYHDLYRKLVAQGKARNYIDISL